LSDYMEVEVVRDKKVYRQSFSRGEPTSKLKVVGADPKGRGTTVAFRPDEKIFGKASFKAEKLYRLVRSKAYLFRGVQIKWICDPSLISGDDVPAKETIHFPGGLSDFLSQQLAGRACVTSEPFTGEADLAKGVGRIEWAIDWP